MTRRPPAWFQVPVPRPHGVRLLCFPYAGGGASSFHSWAKALAAEDVEVCAAQLPGRESRLAEPPRDRLDDLLPALADAVRPLADRPFALFGHSMGALLAFELARLLRSRGEASPCHLFVSGARAPHLPPETEALHNLPDPEFAHAVAEKYQGIPAGVLGNPELLELVLPALRADMKLTESYAFAESPPLAVPLTAWGGTEDHHVPEAALQAWGRHTVGSFSCTLFPGDHFYLGSSRAALFAALRAELARAAA